jgi:hypothetical protein
MVNNMPARMPETHRIRGTRRLLVIMANVNHYGQLVCHLCGKPINESPTIDHYECRSAGADPKDINNCIVAHNECNGRKCNKPAAAVFGQDVHDNIVKYMETRLFSPNDLSEARRINKEYTKTADKLMAVLEYCANN